MDHQYRWEQARDRQLRRDERERQRFPGKMEDLERMRDAPKENLITGRRQRLQIWHPERVQAVPSPKAPPAGIQQPSQATKFALNALSQELRRCYERKYVKKIKTDCQYSLYRDRIEELETRAQDEEDRRNRLRAEEQRVRVFAEEQRLRVQEIKRISAQQQEEEREKREERERLEAYAQRLDAELAERAAREAAELESQAANTEVPQGQVSQVEVREVPQIGAVQSVHSSTGESSSSTGDETLQRQDSANYWDNIVDCEMDYFFDENEITTQVSLLHDGVLYWMTLDEINSLEERWKSGNDPEAKRDYDIYVAEQEQHYATTGLRECEQKD
eukprot:341423-Amphidinium_carterae.5